LGAARLSQALELGGGLGRGSQRPPRAEEADGAILRWLAADFRPGERYPEPEVNRILARRYQDVANLRRLLVDEERLQRGGGVYCRSGSVPYVAFDPPSWPADGPL
jgi:hypothetical protein